MSNRSGGTHRLDQIDRRIIYELMADARHTSAPDIAADLSVSGATIRNRIAKLEEHGIIEGYQATIDFEHGDGSLTNLYLCHTKFGDVEATAHKVGTIPGVINVRELMGGRMNLHVLAVGTDTAALRQIGRELEELGVEIEDEFLLQKELDFPFQPYGPAAGSHSKPLTDYMSLTGGAEVVEVTVGKNAPIVSRTLAEATEEGILEDRALVIAIERDDEVLTPKGNTEIRPNDVVTIFSPNGTSDPVLEGFKSEGEVRRR